MRRRRCQLSAASFPLPLSRSNPMSLSSSPSPSIASTRSSPFFSFTESVSDSARLGVRSVIHFTKLFKQLLQLQEPELLRVDAERIQRQMQEVAVGNYRAFIAAADALLAIREEVSSIDNHLESLVFHNVSIPTVIFQISS